MSVAVFVPIGEDAAERDLVTVLTTAAREELCLDRGHQTRIG
jgi:hypothetical protein